MAGSSEDYQPLSPESSQGWNEGSAQTGNAQRSLSYGCGFEVSKRIPILACVLLVSLVLNVNLLIRAFSTTPQHDSTSSYAGLKRDLPLQIYPETAYTDTNITATAELWENLSGDPGVVALATDFIKEKRLPHAMRFPWDEDRGVYLLQGFHNLHCLRTLFRYIKYVETGEPQRIALSHALHCLDQLRQDVVCNADDTPRYAGFQPGNTPTTGSGQVRMCRDWEELEKWSLAKTACFKHHDEVPGPMIERFKSCPDGRVLWPTKDVSKETAGSTA